MTTSHYSAPTPLAYTVVETASALRVSTTTVRKMIRRGELPVIFTQTHRTLIPVRALHEAVERMSGFQGDAA